MRVSFEKVPDLHNFWKWWSVQLGILTTALGAAATAYGGLLLIDRDLVSGMPQWVGVVISMGTMISAFLSVYVRRLAQPNLEEKCEETKK
jgi:uncharacterized membrane protein YesL